MQDKRVLLSDYELWHYVLNYWYLPKTQADGDAFDRKLDAAGFSTCRFTPDNPLPDAYRQEVETSWQRIFDLEWVAPGVTHSPETKSIQATAWELLLEDVVAATEFVGASLLGGKETATAVIAFPWRAATL